MSSCDLGRLLSWYLRMYELVEVGIFYYGLRNAPELLTWLDRPTSQTDSARGRRFVQLHRCACLALHHSRCISNIGP